MFNPIWHCSRTDRKIQHTKRRLPKVALRRRPFKLTFAKESILVRTPAHTHIHTHPFTQQQQPEKRRKSYLFLWSQLKIALELHLLAQLIFFVWFVWSVAVRFGSIHRIDRIDREKRKSTQKILMDFSVGMLTINSQG